MEELHQFECECLAYLPEEGQDTHIFDLLQNAEKCGLVFDLQELQASVSRIEDDAQVDLAVEPVVASTVKPRWIENLKSDLGKYWQLPEQRAGRTRKQASYFSPC